MSAPTLGPSAAQITMMSHNITARIAEAARRRRRRQRIAIAGAAVGAGLAVTAAGIGVAAIAPAEQGFATSCYLTDDPRGEFTSIVFLDEQSSADDPEPAAFAIEACAVVYGNEGVLAPDPTVCELPDLRLGVFPNARALDDAAFCRALGLGLPPS